MALDEDLAGPKFVQLFGPVLQALKKLGGSARPAEVMEQVAADLNLTEEERSELSPAGSSRFGSRVAWSRFYLVKAGYIDSSHRGVWTLTDKQTGDASMSHEEALELFRTVHQKFQAARKARRKDEADEEETSMPGDEGAPANYQQEVLSVLQDLPANGFERFCQRVLRESGFQEVTVTGHSGDGGIDGIGILQVNALVSFKVLFQCKRYRGSVAPSQVRDFQGAMMGRADKGIIITTGTFSSQAKREAVRDGAPAVELVDGEKLVEMLEQLELGLVPVQSFGVDDKFFDNFRR